VTINLFSTEEYFDLLTMGLEEDLSGDPDVPIDIDFPGGQFSIDWSSDEDTSAGGWRFQLVQVGAEANLALDGVQVQGVGFEVVAAFGKFELLEGVSVQVNIEDNGQDSFSLPPSIDSLSMPLQTFSSAARQSAMEGRRNETEPWLQMDANIKSNANVVWSRGPIEIFSDLATSFGRVRCSITVSDLSLRSILKPSVRKAVSQAVADELGYVTPEDVQVIRMLKVSHSPLASFPPDASKLQSRKAMLFEFEIEPPTSNPQGGLDRVEAKLILLSMGGDAFSKFAKSLGNRFQQAGVAISKSGLVRASMQQPQHLGPRLLASAQRRRLEGARIDDESDDEEEARYEERHTVEATATAALATSVAAFLALGTLFLAISMVALSHRRSRQAAPDPSVPDNLIRITFQEAGAVAQ